MTVAHEIRLERRPDQLDEQQNRRCGGNGFNTTIFIGFAFIILAAAAILFCLFKSQGAGYICIPMAFIASLILVRLYFEDELYASEFHNKICLMSALFYLGAVILFLTYVSGNKLVVIASCILSAFAVLIPLVLYFGGVFATEPAPVFQQLTHRLSHQHRERRDTVNIRYTIRTD